MTCLNFILVKICTFYLHCPLCPTSTSSLIKFDAVFLVFIQVISVYALIDLLFAVQLAIINFHEEPSTTFSLIFLIKLIDFVCIILAIFLSPRSTLIFWPFIIQPLLCFYKFRLFPAKISSLWFIVHDEDSLTFLKHPQPR